MSAETGPVPFVIETSPETFVADVVERSASVPVVIDFWAEWCAPCRILGPILENLATEFAGRFVLVKANTELMGEIAQAFNVQSIPAVFGIKAGKVVASFAGALPEATVRAWIEKLMPTPAETLAIEARSLEAIDPAAAEARYREVLALVPDNVPTRIAIARMALAQGRPEEARTTVEALERRGFLEPEAETLKAELLLKRPSGGLEALRSAVQADPKNKQGQLELAEALAAAGEYEEALTLALDLVERDRRGTGESARKMMIAVFQILPAESSVANDFRRQLSFAL